MAGILALPVMLMSCLFEEQVSMTAPGIKPAEEGTEILLGRKLKNPYALAHMTQALQNLKLRYEDPAITEVVETHRYVRLMRDDSPAYEQIALDSSIVLFNHPLDYEVLRPGDYYNDPNAGTSANWQYAAIPVGYNIPSGLRFEVLESLYLPEADQRLHNKSGRIASSRQDFVDMLEDEALVITGNAIHGDDVDEGRAPARWHPAGIVTVYDNRLKKFIPLEGVKIQARRWFTTHQAITAKDGRYYMEGSFRRDAHYRLLWERSRFDIRSGTFGQAKINGPKIKGDWNVEIRRDGMNFHYAHVFRAAMRYYYGDIDGLQKPGFRIRYSVFNKRGNHMARNIGNWSVFGINPNILIYRYSSLDGSENDADEMYSTTCHETAHATHLERMRGGAVQFCQVTEKIRESWAIGVEWYITRKEYKELGIANYGEASYGVKANYPTLFGYQYWNRARSTTLTSLFIDLVDNHNQDGQAFGNYRRGTVADRVSGFELAEIEAGLKDIYGLGSLADRLKSVKPVEVADKEIDGFLDHF